MTLFDEAMKNIPEYYSSMYLDGYAPEQILTAARNKVLENTVDQENEEYQVIIETRIKK